MNIININNFNHKIIVDILKIDNFKNLLITIQDIKIYYLFFKKKYYVEKKISNNNIYVLQI